jgi:hypothetical protein
MTPAEPIRIDDVRPATAASSTAGLAPATPGTPWCSATQKRS